MMKNKNTKKIQFSTLGAVVLILLFSSCERDISDDSTLATYPNTADIFTDAPVGMGSNFYLPYGPDSTNPVGSKPTAWSVDNLVSYQGTASMRFDVPNANDPEGNFAGALFKVDGGGRNLTNYNVLTFWAKASQGCTISEIGFGEGDFATKILNVSLGTKWTKYYIPIPDASKYLQEKGMLFYSAGSINGNGFTFWIDELKFEKLGTIGNPVPYINNGLDETFAAFVGDNNFKINDIGATYNLPNGFNQNVIINSQFFDVTSSNSSIATTNQGKISIVGSGSTQITCSLKGIQAKGTLTLNSTPLAPNPILPASKVISVFSETYINNPVEYYNGYWAPYQKTKGQDDINVSGNKIIRYTELNFVGIEFQKSPINISQMTHFHIDILFNDTVEPSDVFKIKLSNLGNSTGEITLKSPTIFKGGWVSLDLPLSSFQGLNPNTTDLKQIIFDSQVNNVGSLSTVLIDNIYFHN
jgi:hypothetical protein